MNEENNHQLSVELDLQIATNFKNIPTEEQFVTWCDATLVYLKHNKCAEVTIRLVDNSEIQQLNHDYRGKDKPTNVLSFPFEPYEALMAYAGDAAELNLLGDMIIAPAVIEQEAIDQGKSLMSHFAHMTIHGILHLLDYDHIEAAQADEMESLEVNILKSLGIANPYVV